MSLDGLARGNEDGGRRWGKGRSSSKTKAVNFGTQQKRLRCVQEVRSDRRIMQARCSSIDSVNALLQATGTITHRLGELELFRRFPTEQVDNAAAVETCSSAVRGPDTWRRQGKGGSQARLMTYWRITVQTTNCSLLILVVDQLIRSLSWMKLLLWVG